MNLIKDINDTVQANEVEAATKLADAAEIEALAAATNDIANGKSIADYMADIAQTPVDK